MKHLFTIIILCLILAGCSKEARLQRAIDGIGKSNYYMSAAVGITGSKPDEYKHYETIVDLATPQQLQKLILDDHPSVRIYGFQAMVETNHPKTFEAFKLICKDTTALGTMVGCFMSGDQLNSLAVNILENPYKKKHQFKLKGNEKIAFDSLLLFLDELPPQPWSHALSEIFPVEKHYCIVKEFAEEVPGYSATLSLANFQKEEDINLLREGFSFNDPSKYRQTMDIIFRFPHSSFLTYLKSVQEYLLGKHAENYEFTEFYLAVFRYSPSEIQPFLMALKENSDSKTVSRHLQNAWIAAQLNNNPAKRKLARKVSLDDDGLRSLEWFQDMEKYTHCQ